MTTPYEVLNIIEDIVYVHKDYWNETKKKLKILEIIKEKMVDVFQLLIAIKVNDLNEYNKRHAKYLQLTQEEYDLLKEVLL